MQAEKPGKDASRFTHGAVRLAGQLHPGRDHLDARCGNAHRHNGVGGCGRHGEHRSCPAVRACLEHGGGAAQTQAAVRLAIRVVRCVHQRRQHTTPDENTARTAECVDEVGAVAVQDQPVAVELQREIDRRSAGAPRIDRGVAAAARDGVHVHAGALQRITRAVEHDALTTCRRIVVVAGERDADHV